MPTNATRPGLAPYSDEWMAEVATHVAEPLRPVVRAICEAYQLGDSDAPNTLARIIEEELAKSLGQNHDIGEGDHVFSDAVGLSTTGWFMIGDAVDGIEYMYGVERIRK